MQPVKSFAKQVLIIMKYVWQKRQSKEWRNLMEISAVIPCYNGEKFLEEAVASINNQTYLPREIVIVNDGSTDGSKSIIERLKATSKA